MALITSIGDLGPGPGLWRRWASTRDFSSSTCLIYSNIHPMNVSEMCSWCTHLIRSVVTFDSRAYAVASKSFLGRKHPRAY